MHRITQLCGFMKSKRGPVRIGNTGTATGWTTSATSRSMTSVNLGTAAEDRYVIVGTGARDDDGTYSASSVTIAGVSATKLIDGTMTSSRQCSIWVARVPAGTSGQTITATWSEAIAFDQHFAWVVVYGLAGLHAMTAQHMSGITTTTVTFPSVQAEAGGLAIWCGAMYGSGGGNATLGAVPNLASGGIVEVCDQTGGSMAFVFGFAVLRQNATFDMTLYQDHPSPFHSAAVATLRAA